MRNATPNEQVDPRSPATLREDAAKAMERLREAFDPAVFTPNLCRDMVTGISAMGLASFSAGQAMEQMAWMAATAAVYPILADIIEQAEGKP